MFVSKVAPITVQKDLAKRIKGDTKCSRLYKFKSKKPIYVQIIDDEMD